MTFLEAFLNMSLISACFIDVFLQQTSKTSELSVFGLLYLSIRLTGFPDYHRMGLRNFAVCIFLQVIFISHMPLNFLLKIPLFNNLKEIMII
jgi:hypothetical protein